MERESNLQILRNIKDGEFLIRNFAIDPRYGYRAEFGDLVPVDPQSMRERGMEIVLTNLVGFFERDALKDLNERPRRSRQENARLDRSNRLVSVALSGDELRLEPMKRVRGGFTGTDSPTITLATSSTNEEFFRLLMKAFSICGPVKGPPTFP